ncbi:hypothetical protein [Methylobacterium fujisawaense]|uniref:hypothetical protein n=1 Tax=Methylobacterium fujisawaense TaxID=107400 RepID=UPI00313BDB42
MSTLWVWTQQTGVVAYPERHPENYDGARSMAAPALGKVGREDEVGCHKFDVETGTDAGTQEVYLTWSTEEYDPLVSFLESAAGEKYLKRIGGIPPPEPVRPALGR